MSKPYHNSVEHIRKPGFKTCYFPSAWVSHDASEWFHVVTDDNSCRNVHNVLRHSEIYMKKVEQSSQGLEKCFMK